MQQSLTGMRIVTSEAITHADNGSTVLAVEVPAGTWVPPYGVTIYVAEAFVGGTPSIDVGDGDNDDGWVDTTEITEATPGCYTGVAAAYAIAGKYYSAADTIDAVVADTTLTDGTAYIMVQMLDVSALDLSAQ